jgi:hypothetical protein
VFFPFLGFQVGWAMAFSVWAWLGRDRERFQGSLRGLGSGQGGAWSLGLKREGAPGTFYKFERRDEIQSRGWKKGGPRVGF